MGRSVNGARMPYWSRGLVAALAALSVSSSAFAAVRREGVWPEKDTAVSLDLTRVPRDKAIKRLAEAAGWSIVVHAPDGDPVDVHVKDQPASKVLDILLMDENYVANRDGSLIAITRATAAAPPVPSVPPALPVPPEPPAPSDANVVGPRPPMPPTPPTPPTPPAPPSPPSLTSVVAPPPPPLPPPSPPSRGADRVITGDSLTIEKGETVHDVSVFGGSLKVKGTVTGDIAVMGGSVRLREGSLVMGDASVFGGSLTLEDGARVDGDVEVLGGSIKRGDNAFIGGEISEDGRKTEHVHPEAQDSGGPEASAGSHHEEEDHEGTAARLAREAGSAISSMALLFVFGAVLLALAPKRMEMLKVEVAARPMRSFAMGVVGVLMSVVIVVAVCVTIIGIPFAVIGLLLALVAMWGGACAVLETAGAALLGHRTKNSYAHLAAGCVLLLFIGAIPYIGNFAFAALLLTGIGSLVSTRGAGLFPLKTPPQNNGGSVPYRSISTDP